MLQESWNKNALPFAQYAPGAITPTEQCFQIRAVNDELAGVQLRRRLPDAPAHVQGWLYRRGGDYYLGAYVADGQLTQLVEIFTRSPRLRVVDCFGNAQTAVPVNGKVRLLLTNLETFVHGLGPNDAIRFIPHLQNERPEIADPGKPMAMVAIDATALVESCRLSSTRE
jgi:hypothetical protein